MTELERQDLMHQIKQIDDYFRRDELRTITVKVHWKKIKEYVDSLVAEVGYIKANSE